MTTLYTGRVLRKSVTGEITIFDDIISAVTATPESNHSQISKSLNHKRKTHDGYEWIREEYSGTQDEIWKTDEETGIKCSNMGRRLSKHSKSDNLCVRSGTKTWIGKQCYNVDSIIMRTFVRQADPGERIWHCNGDTEDITLSNLRYIKSVVVERDPSTRGTIMKWYCEEDEETIFYECTVYFDKVHNKRTTFRSHSLDEVRQWNLQMRVNAGYVNWTRVERNIEKADDERFRILVPRTHNTHHTYASSYEEAIRIRDELEAHDTNANDPRRKSKTNKKRKFTDSSFECSVCNVLLPLESFSVDNKRFNGRRSTCKSCSQNQHVLRRTSWIGKMGALFQGMVTNTKLRNRKSRTLVAPQWENVRCFREFAFMTLKSMDYKCAISGCKLTVDNITVERKNNDVGYTPSNCIFIALHFQSGQHHAQWTGHKFLMVPQLRQSASEIYDVGDVYRMAKRMVQHSRHSLTMKGRKKRKLEHSLTEDDIVQMFLAQHGRCYYLNIPMKLDGKVSWRASLERLNPDGGYTVQNCALICLETNLSWQWSKEIASTYFE